MTTMTAVTHAQLRRCRRHHHHHSNSSNNNDTVRLVLCSLLLLLCVVSPPSPSRRRLHDGCNVRVASSTTTTRVCTSCAQQQEQQQCAVQPQLLFYAHAIRVPDTYGNFARARDDDGDDGDDGVLINATHRLLLTRTSLAVDVEGAVLQQTNTTTLTVDDVNEAGVRGKRVGDDAASSSSSPTTMVAPVAAVSSTHNEHNSSNNNVTSLSLPPYVPNACGWPRTASAFWCRTRHRTFVTRALFELLVRATAVQLTRRGRIALELDDALPRVLLPAILQYAPYLHTPYAPAVNVTLRMLLRHTSGFAPVANNTTTTTTATAAAAAAAAADVVVNNNNSDTAGQTRVWDAYVNDLVATRGVAAYVDCTPGTAACYAHSFVNTALAAAVLQRALEQSATTTTTTRARATGAALGRNSSSSNSNSGRRVSRGEDGVAALDAFSAELQRMWFDALQLQQTHFVRVSSWPLPPPSSSLSTTTTLSTEANVTTSTGPLRLPTSADVYGTMQTSLYDVSRLLYALLLPYGARYADIGVPLRNAAAMPLTAMTEQQQQLQHAVMATSSHTALSSPSWPYAATALTDGFLATTYDAVCATARVVDPVVYMWCVHLAWRNDNDSSSSSSSSDSSSSSTSKTSGWLYAYVSDDDVYTQLTLVCRYRDDDDSTSSSTTSSSSSSSSHARQQRMHGRCAVHVVDVAPVQNATPLPTVVPVVPTPDNEPRMTSAMGAYVFLGVLASVVVTVVCSLIVDYAIQPPRPVKVRLPPPAPLSSAATMNADATAAITMNAAAAAAAAARDGGGAVMWPTRARTLPSAVPAVSFLQPAAVTADAIATTTTAAAATDMPPPQPQPLSSYALPPVNDNIPRIDLYDSDDDDVSEEEQQQQQQQQHEVRSAAAAAAGGNMLSPPPLHDSDDGGAAAVVHTSAAPHTRDDVVSHGSSHDVSIDSHDNVSSHSGGNNNNDDGGNSSSTRRRRRVSHTRSPPRIDLYS